MTRIETVAGLNATGASLSPVWDLAQRGESGTRLEQNPFPGLVLIFFIFNSLQKSSRSGKWPSACLSIDGGTLGMETHTYNVSVTWLNNRLGVAEADGVRDTLKFSAPPEFGGEPGLWSPELFLVSAASSCFLSTLLVLAERSRLPLVGYRAEAEGQLERGPQGYRFTHLVVRPVVTLEKESDIPLAYRLLEKAERACIVANALAIPVRVEARVEVIAPAPIG